MTNKGALAAVVAIIVVVAAIVGCVFAFTSNGNNCNVTYDLNYDDSPVGEIVSYRSGSEITDPPNPEFRVDHTFAGWFLDRDCKNEVTFPYKVEGDVTFYAKWTTSIAAKYFNENFFHDNEVGIALAESQRTTVDFTQLQVDGENLDVQFITYGYDHFVVLDMSAGIEEACYDIVDFDERRTVFTIPEDEVFSIVSVTRDECDTEFVIVEDYDGQLTIYDLHGNTEGPADDVPVILLHKIVIFDNQYYTFNEDGSIEWQFEITSDHVPVAGDGASFCEFDGMTVNEDGSVHYDCFNILDERFELVESMPLPFDAVRCVCFYIYDGYYLMQYSIPTDSEYYTYSDGGVKYELESFIVNGDTCEIRFVEMKNPAFVSADLMAKEGFAITLAPDIRNIISFYKVDENGVLDTSGKLLWVINPEGEIEKSFSISESDYQFSVIFPLTEHGKYMVISVYDEDTEEPMTVVSIVDGSGDEFEIVLYDIKVTDCLAYFISNAADESERTDFNIYDAYGNVVGDFEGMRYVDSTNNLLFFEDESDLYVFSEGEMHMVHGYAGGLSCGESYYCYTEDGYTYTFFTENGTEICSSPSNDCDEITTKNGTHIIQIYLGDGESAVFELTAE